MSNVVENNNSFNDYTQVWSKYVFIDDVPSEPPLLELEHRSFTKNNTDEGSQYTLHIFQKTEHENTYDYLLYVSNLKLIKEFRQGKSWILKLGDTEEAVRNVILPSMTASRSYTPSFSDGDFEIPFTSVNPDFNFRDCRIEVGLDFEKLYFSGWLYIGKNLKVLLEKNLPPFDDIMYLLKNSQTGNKASFQVTAEKRYKLPSDTFEDTENSNTILSTNILNQAINQFGILDEGEYW